MIIATSITQDYLERSRPFFESVNKHFKGKKIVFCIGFALTEQIEGWEVVCVHQSHLKSHIKDFPQNRKNYYSMQHGEFIDWYKFDDEDEVLFVDSDMILQRPFDLRFNFDETDFYVSDSSFPATPLAQVIKNLNCRISYRSFMEQFEIDEDETEFTAAFLVAKVKNWRRMYHHILVIQEEFLKHFPHHAAWQLLINYIIINYLRYETVDPLIQNADWYSGTKAVNKDDVLMIGKDIVYFNHTKFNGNYKY